MRTDFFDSGIINCKDIEENLVRIFPDSIIIDTNFHIVDISQTVLDLLGYEKDQVISRPLDLIVNDEQNKVLPELRSRLHVQSACKLKGSKNRETEVIMSGYYLGLISDINGKIVLQVKDRNDYLSLKGKLDEKVTEFNNFVYRTAHDLKGPIATIKGLVLISQMENKPEDVLKYLDLIYKVADKLDFMLASLKETLNDDTITVIERETMDFVEDLTARIISFEKLNHYDFEVIADCNNLDKKFKFRNNPSLVFSLVQNLLLILNFSNEFPGCPYKVKISAEANELYIDFVCEGINITSLNNLFKVGLFSKSDNTDYCGNNYNFMSISILKKCLTMTRSLLKLFYKDNNALIRITVPSINIPKKNI